MPVTSKYLLPSPASASAFVRNGATAIQQLAEAVEAALLPPLLATDGDGTLSWDTKVAEIPWDVTDNPDRKRGTWTSAGANERLVIPATPGWYLVSTSVLFTGKAEPDVYDVRINSRVLGSVVGTGITWGRVRVDVPNSSSDDTVVNVSSLVRVPSTDPKTGFAIRVAYKGSTQPPATTAGNNKLRAIRVSAL